MNISMNVKKLCDKATLPVYASEYAAGADLYACLDEPVTIEPNETKLIKTEQPLSFCAIISISAGSALFFSSNHISIVFLIKSIFLHKISLFSQKMVRKIIFCPY